MAEGEEVQFRVYLGKGEEGAARLEALKRLAARHLCFWGNEPSIGRLIVLLADEEMEKEPLRMRVEHLAFFAPRPARDDSPRRGRITAAIARFPVGSTFEWRGERYVVSRHGPLEITAESGDGQQWVFDWRHLEELPDATPAEAD